MFDLFQDKDDHCVQVTFAIGGAVFGWDNKEARGGINDAVGVAVLRVGANGFDANVGDILVTRSAAVSGFRAIAFHVWDCHLSRLDHVILGDRVFGDSVATLCLRHVDTRDARFVCVHVVVVDGGHLVAVFACGVCVFRP